MTVSILAEAGLSECASSGTDCMPGFGLFLTGLMVAGFVLFVWITAALSATVSVVTTPLGAQRTALWVLAVWIVPWGGAIGWFVYARRQRTSIES